MFAVFQFAFNAVAPIICLVLVGWTARQLGFVDIPSLKKINKLNFRFCFTALMFSNLYSMESLENLPLGLFGTLLFSLAVLTGVGWLAARFFTDRRERKAVLMQSAFRSNYAIIGLMLAESLGGQDGLALATMTQLPCVLYFNVLAVLCFSVYADEAGAVSPGKILKSIVTNPLIVGLFAGSMALVIRGILPLNEAGEKVFLLSRDLPWLYQTISYLSRIATPLALIVLGGQLVFSEVGAFKRELVAGITTRLLLTPVIGLSLSWLAGQLGIITLTPGVWAVLISAFGSPLAVATSVMATEMGADDRYAGQLVVWTTVLSMGTLFLIVFLLRAVGQL